MLKRVLLAAVTAAMLAGPAWAGETLDAIRARGVLLVGTTGDYKPFTFREEDGTYRGADIEMAKRLADRLGVKLELVPTVWAKLMDDFTAKKFDIAMGGVTILPARAKVGDFSAVIYVDGKRPVARCPDKDRFTSIEAIDRPDVRVVVNPGASNEQFAREHFPHAKLTIHKDNATVFDEIVANREDVMVTDGIEVDHQAYIHPELCPAKVNAPFTRLEKAYWLQKDPELLALVNQWLAAEKNGGAWDRILEAAQKAP
ncbi:MAG TPA: transporter substrate-binding domain-containing protein [Acetobacteraceae bacterium]|nr:transporter substrate-binding domain-containing protein [Acetobacteraceae bacterium]